MKNQSQRDLERHWSEQSKKLTPAERLAAKAEKVRKQIERDKAFLERRRKEGEESAPEPAGSAPEVKSGNSKAARTARRRAKE